MIALVGNPNCGKSALFNILTKSNQKIGNFPGITVDIEKRKYKEDIMVDLPGLYSLNYYTKDEKVTVDFLNKNNISLIVNVIDINFLNRSLYLTLQLLKLNIPLIIVLNKCDSNTLIKENKLKELLKVNVIKISATKNKNIDKLKHLIEKKKFVFHNYQDDFTVEKRYYKIDQICNEVIKENNSFKLSNIIDKFLLNKFFSKLIAILIFILIYYLLNIVGNYFTSKISNLMFLFKNLIFNILNKLNLSIILKDLIINGIFSGINNVVLFFIQIIILIFMFSFLEDSGYITRLSIIFNNLLNKIGLSGKSFTYFLFGISCSASSILSTRSLKDDLERKKVIFLLPFIPCSAKISIILFVTTYYFHNSFFIFLSFYLIAIIIIYILSFVFKSKKFEYIMEVPPLKVPSIKVVFNNTLIKLKDILIRIFSIMLFFSIINWFLLSFDVHLNYNVSFENSILYLIGNKLSFLTKPLIGYNDSKTLVSILSGIIAKEQVVSTIGVLKVKFLSVISAYSFCLFNLFSIPCINTLSAIKNECGFKTMLIYGFIYMLISYIISIILFRSLIWIL